MNLDRSPSTEALILWPVSYTQSRGRDFEVIDTPELEQLEGRAVVSQLPIRDSVTVSRHGAYKRHSFEIKYRSIFPIRLPKDEGVKGQAVAGGLMIND